MAENNICKHVSGCMAKIEHLEGESETMRNRVDKIFSRINLILGGIVVSCVMLVINLMK